MLECNGLISTFASDKSIECMAECVWSNDSWDRDVRNRWLINALKINIDFIRYDNKLIMIRQISEKETYAIWWSLLGLLSWYPLILVKALQLIWRSGTCRFRYPNFKWVEVTWLWDRVPVQKFHSWPPGWHPPLGLQWSWLSIAPTQCNAFSLFNTEAWTKWLHSADNIFKYIFENAYILIKI